MTIRCRLFGHEWLHLDTHFIDERILSASYLCDRCDERRAIQMETKYPDEEPAGGDDA